ncbi:MAG: DUF1634 domain-containing protein [Ilumatobacteraceae bacterium]|jgi:uncharacterized membrane protein
MSDEVRRADDAAVHRTEEAISIVLRVGVLISVALVVAGTIVTFVHHHEYVSDPSSLDGVVEPGAGFPRTLAGVASGIADGRGQAIVSLGLLVLVATPVIRVAVSIVAFAQRRDRIFVTITSIVLALLLASFALGRAGG